VLDREYEATVFLRKVRNCIPVDTELQPRRHESSNCNTDITVLWHAAMIVTWQK